MMNIPNPVLWIDQTLSAGLPPGGHPRHYEQLAALLKSLYVGLADITPSDYPAARLANHSGVCLPYRAIVPPSPDLIAQAQNLGFHQIIITYHHQDNPVTATELAAAVALAWKLKMLPTLHLTNASAIPTSELIRLWRHQPGFDTPIWAYGDADSLLDPPTTFAALTALRHALPCRLEFHAANACGLATANALAAIRAGVGRIATAVGGLYNRAASEELLMIHKILLRASAPPTGHLADACQRVLTLLAQPAPRNKSLIGEDIFAHESGIHVDAVLKDSRLYEPFPPEEVGLQRRLVIGKHSGTASLKNRFREWGIDLTDGLAEELLTAVRRLAVQTRGAVSDQQLRELYRVTRQERSTAYVGYQPSATHRHHAP